MTIQPKARIKPARLAPALVLAACAQLPLSALAQEYGPTLDYSVGLRAEFDDNVTLDPDNAVDDILLAPFVTFGLDRQGSNVDARLSGFFEYVDYQDNTFGSEVRANLAADVLWRIADERFHWVLENGLTRSTIDILAVDTPDNLQETNAFSTGPDFIFRFGGIDRLVLGARYNNFYAAEDDTPDYDGFSLQGRWARQVSETRSYGLSVETSTNEFDQTSLFANDFDRTQFSLFYEDTRSLTGGALDTLSINLGYSEADFENPLTEDIDTPLFRLEWARETQDGSSMGVNLAREIGDAFGDSAGIQLANSASLIAQTAVIGEPFTRELISGNWSRPLGQRFRMQLDATYDSQSYDTAPLDQDRIELAGQLTWQIRPLLRLTTRAAFIDQEFQDTGQEDDRLLTTVSLSYQRTRNLFIELVGRYSSQDSTVPQVEFNSRAIVAQVTYRR